MKAYLPRFNSASGSSIGYKEAQIEPASRYEAISYAGLVPIKSMLMRLEFDKDVNDHLQLFKLRRGYAESDHVFALSFNALQGGRTLDDVERMRRDPALLNALDAASISDPTTLGDFCRRFTRQNVDELQDAVNRTRLKVWSTQPESFHKRATLDADGVFVKTGAECAEGVEYLAPKREWGYHPLVVSLAETQEPLFIVNRPGARPSHELAHHYFDKAVDLCKEAGFEKVLMRGDTAFTQTRHLDKWDETEGVEFVFGMSAAPGLVERAESLSDESWSPLLREVRDVDEDLERSQQERRKQKVVEERGYKDLRLEKEDIAEIPWSPTACLRTYRLVILRKTISVHKGQETLYPEKRYFFYISNCKGHTPAEIVRESNLRCNQENLNAHLNSGVHALRAPLKTMVSNWAYMVTTALAWSFKAWFALTGEFDVQNPGAQKSVSHRLLTMEFRTFLNEFIAIPALVISSGRQLFLRLLSNPPWARHLVAAHANLRE